VRLADYKIKFFDFVAANLRRLAGFLTVENAPEKENSAPEKTLSPMEDWLEKTRRVAPENWVGFSGAGELEAIGENEAEPEIQPPVSSFADETGAEDLVFKNPKKQSPGETFFENERKASKTLETFDKFEISNKASNKSEISPAEKPKKPKTDSRFFSFEFSDKKKKEKTAAPLEPFSEISRQAPAKDEKPMATAKRNFRLFPAESVSENKPETVEPDIINSLENQPPGFEISPFERKKSAALKIEKIVPAKPKNTVENPEEIVKKSAAARGISDQFSPAAFSRKTGGESAAEISFEFPKRKTNSAAALSAFDETAAAAETPNFSSPRTKKSRIAVQEYFSPERDKKTDNQTDNPKKFAAAQSPWIDLPDETAPEATDDIHLNLSENEHLRFLEGEQAGKLEKLRR
jgi:hypothetical protein